MNYVLVYTDCRLKRPYMYICLRCGYFPHKPLLVGLLISVIFSCIRHVWSISGLSVVKPLQPLFATPSPYNDNLSDWNTTFAYKIRLLCACGIYTKWGLCCQKQVSQAGISNYIPRFILYSNHLTILCYELLNVSTDACPWLCQNGYFKGISRIKRTIAVPQQQLA